MTLTKKRLLGGAGIAALLLAVPVFVSMNANASDHTDAPAATNRASADISDLYVWAADGNTTAIMTVNPLTPAGMMAGYDADVLYGFHFDTNADNASDVDIWVRFGQNDAGDWGMQVTSPGGTMVGAAGELIDDGNSRAWAGTSDDPFFFDFEGYQNTVANGTLGFDPTRDSFAGTNVLSIAIQMPTADIGAGAFTAWATTGAF
jgi:hypothetical protein